MRHNHANIMIEKEGKQLIDSTGESCLEAAQRKLYSDMNKLRSHSGTIYSTERNTLSSGLQCMD